MDYNLSLLIAGSLFFPVYISQWVSFLQGASHFCALSLLQCNCFKQPWRKLPLLPYQRSRSLHIHIQRSQYWLGLRSRGCIWGNSRLGSMAYSWQKKMERSRQVREDATTVDIGHPRQKVKAGCKWGKVKTCWGRISMKKETKQENLSKL